jgi:hypothetical protein
MEIGDLKHFPVDAGRAIAKHDKVVVVTDLLGARVFAPAVADHIVSLIRHDGPKVERNAFLVGESAIFSMQIERIIRDSGAHGRRAFRHAPDLEQWLADSLSRVERARLPQFLAEGVASRVLQPHP